jgi:hypothetical protein
VESVLIYSVGAAGWETLWGGEVSKWSVAITKAKPANYNMVFISKNAISEALGYIRG